MIDVLGTSEAKVGERNQPDLEMCAKAVEIEPATVILCDVPTDFDSEALGLRLETVLHRGIV
jgi:hypothetical protein